MRKNRAPIYVEEAPRSLRPGLILRFLLAATAVGPFVFEGGLMLYARWMRAFGHRVAYRTPVLDHLGQLARWALGSVMHQFRRVPWNPQAVILVGIACCAACIFLLKGKGSRIE